MCFLYGLNRFTLPLDKLFGIGVDGAEVNLGVRNGVVARLIRHLKRWIVSFHCCGHQTQLSAEVGHTASGPFGEQVTKILGNIHFTSTKSVQIKTYVPHNFWIQVDVYRKFSYITNTWPICRIRYFIQIIWLVGLLTWRVIKDFSASPSNQAIF